MVRWPHSRLFNIRSKRGISPAAKRLSSACQLAQTHAAKVRSNGAASARDTDAKPVLTTAVKMHPVTTKVVGCHCGQRPVDDSRRRPRRRELKAARLSGFSWPTKILLGQPRHFLALHHRTPPEAELRGQSFRLCTATAENCRRPSPWGTKSTSDASGFSKTGPRPRRSSLSTPVRLTNTSASNGWAGGILGFRPRGPLPVFLSSLPTPSAIHHPATSIASSSFFPFPSNPPSWFSPVVWSHPFHLVLQPIPSRPTLKGEFAARFCPGYTNPLSPSESLKRPPRPDLRPNTFAFINRLTTGSAWLWRKRVGKRRSTQR